MHRIAQFICLSQIDMIDLKEKTNKYFQITHFVAISEILSFEGEALSEIRELLLESRVTSR